MVKNDQTAGNLRSAYGGESQAYQRYIVWGEKAEKDGFSNVATLFKAIAYAEQVHAGNHFEALENVEGDFLVASGAVFGIAHTADNLEGAIAGEDYEIEQMYPSFQLVAKNQKENDAIRSFQYALEAEKIHSRLYNEALEAVKAGKDYELDTVSICSVCGHTSKDDTPEYCPVCGAKKEDYKVFGS